MPTLDELESKYGKSNSFGDGSNDEDFVEGNQEGTGLGTRIAGGVTGAVAGATAGGSIAGLPGAIVGGAGGAVYGAVKPEKTLNTVKKTTQGLLRSAHYNAAEKDADTKMNRVNTKLSAAYNQWLKNKDPEFAELNSPYKLITSSISPKKVLENFKKDTMYQKEFFSTPYAQVLLNEKYQYLKAMGSSSVERTVKYGLAKTFTSEDIAKKVSGASDDDIKNNEDAYTGARAVGEVTALAAANKLLKILPGGNVLKEAPKEANLFQKAAVSGYQAGRYGVAYEGTKQLFQPNSIEEKGKEIAKSGATFGVAGAAVPVVGAGLVKTGETIGKGLKMFGKAADAVIHKLVTTGEDTKLGQAIVKSRAEAAKKSMARANNILKYAKDIKVPTETPGYAKEMASDVFYNFAIKEAGEVNNLSRQARNTNMIFRQMKSFKVPEKVMKQEAIRTRILTLHDKIYKLKLNTPRGRLDVGKFLNKMPKDRAEMIGKAFVKPELVSQLTPDEQIVYRQYKRIDKIGDKLLAGMTTEQKIAEGKELLERGRKYNKDIWIKKGQEMIDKAKNLKTFKQGKLTQNYLKRMYSDELQETVVELQTLGYSKNGINEVIKQKYGKNAPSALLDAMMSNKPRQGSTDLYTTILKTRKLSDKAVEPFINYDIRKVMERYTQELAKEVADRPLIEGFQGALKMIDQMPERSIPAKNRAFIQQLVDSFHPNRNLTPEAIRVGWKEWVATKSPKAWRPLLRTIKDPIEFAENHALAANAFLGLGFKPAFMLKNTTQPAIDLYLGVPMKHWSNAAKTVAGNELGRQKLPMKYRWIMKEPMFVNRKYDLGTVVPTGVGIDLPTATSKAAEKFRRAAFFTVQNSDRPNVKRSMIAFYDWGRELGMDHKKAKWFANVGASMSEFEYYSNSRAVFAKTAIGKPLMMFKSWGINYFDTILHGRQALYNEFQQHMPVEYLNFSESLMNGTMYLTTQYGSVAAIMAMSGLDISGANPDQVLKSTFLDAPLDVAGKTFNLFPVTKNGDFNRAFSSSTPGRWIRWTQGKVDSPFGRTTREYKEAKKKSLF